jgi:hypothetical protein
LSDFFDNIFDHFLCAFRKGHGCQTTLLKIPESIDMFIIFVIGDKSDILPSFINLTEILSTPVTFLTLNLSMTLDTESHRNYHKQMNKTKLFYSIAP